MKIGSLDIPGMEAAVEAIRLTSPTSREGSAPASEPAPADAPERRTGRARPRARHLATDVGLAASRVGFRGAAVAVAAAAPSRGFAPIGRLLAPLAPHPAPAPPQPARRSSSWSSSSPASARRSTVGGVTAVTWTETADFCGRCHTMDPELKAYELSPHREVACAECHVEPGRRRLGQGQAQRHAPARHGPDGQLPDADPAARPRATCRRPARPASAATTRSRWWRTAGRSSSCSRSGSTRTRPNTKDTVALVLRPAGLRRRRPPPAASTGTSPRTSSTCRPTARPDDRLRRDQRGRRRGRRSTSPRTQVTSSTDVQPDIDRLKAERRRSAGWTASTATTGSATACRRRTRRSTTRISAQRIDRSLPFIKREASDRLAADYASVEDADRAIEGMRDVLRPAVPAGGQGEGRPDQRSRSTTSSGSTGSWPRPR